MSVGLNLKLYKVQRRVTGFAGMWRCRASPTVATGEENNAASASTFALPFPFLSTSDLCLLYLFLPLGHRLCQKKSQSRKQYFHQTTTTNIGWLVWLILGDIY